MGFFDFGRVERFPTQYDELRTPVTVDVLEAGFILAFFILLFSFYLLLPGPNSLSKLYQFIRITCSLLIGLLLMLGNVGQEWEVSHITATTPYRIGATEEITADIGIKIGLRSVNVTLKSNTSGTSLASEMIDYNERFEWTWDQGRFGFGPYAGLLQRSFREAQHKGLPLPILWIVDYFVIDGEGLRFGRFYRTAGWYTHILLWTALPCWLMANLMFLNVIRYGAFLILCCGALQLSACIVWASIRNPIELFIPFDDKFIITCYGSSFYITLFSGLFCTIIGIVIIFADLRHPDEIALFFGLDPVSEYESVHLTDAELEHLLGKKKPINNDIEMNVPEVQPPPRPPHNYMKRRTTMKRAQKSLFKQPVMHPEEEAEIYFDLPGHSIVPQRF